MPDFPQNPFPIVGILQGAGAGVTVKGTNLSTGGSEEVSTESDGSYIIDPANMTGGYSDGDVIRISSGTWYTDVKIDLVNYPAGIAANLSRTIIITPRRISRGASLERGISCGY
jgi:hypothetical protein